MLLSAPAQPVPGKVCHFYRPCPTVTLLVRMFLSLCLAPKRFKREPRKNAASRNHSNSRPPGRGRPDNSETISSAMTKWCLIRSREIKAVFCFGPGFRLAEALYRRRGLRRHRHTGRSTRPFPTNPSALMPKGRSRKSFHSSTLYALKTK